MSSFPRQAPSRPSGKGSTERPGSRNSWASGSSGGGGGAANSSSAPWSSQYYQGQTQAERGGASPATSEKQSGGGVSYKEESPKPARRKRSRGAVKSEESSEYGGDDDGDDKDNGEIDQALWDVQMPAECEDDFINAIFNLGLKTSSPKVLIQLMSATEGLTTEHIKSHLQKYRLHHSRSEQEFMEYYHAYIQGPFREFVAQRGWELTPRRPHDDGDDNSSQGPDFDSYRPSTRMPVLDYDAHVQQVQTLSSQMLQGQMELQSNLQQYISNQIRLQGQLVQQLQQHRPSATGPNGASSGGVAALLDPLFSVMDPFPGIMFPSMDPPQLPPPLPPPPLPPPPSEPSYQQVQQFQRSRGPMPQRMAYYQQQQHQQPQQQQQQQQPPPQHSQPRPQLSYYTDNTASRHHGI